MAIGSFRIELFSAASVRLATFVDIQVGTWTRNVSSKGQFDFTLTSSEVADAGADIESGNFIRIYHEVIGFMGKFYVNTVAYESTTKNFKIQCDDQITELMLDDVGYIEYGTSSQGVLISSIITDLLARASWAVPTISLNDDTNEHLIYLNENYLQAIELLVKYTGSYYSLIAGQESTMRFGQFRDSGVIYSRYNLANYFNDVYFATGIDYSTAAGYIYSLDYLSADIVPVNSMSLVRSAVETAQPQSVVNKIIPNGSGVFPVYSPSGVKSGEGLLHLGLSDRTAGRPIKFKTEASTDIVPGDIVWHTTKHQYYMADSYSIQTYSIRSKVLSYLEIKPITNSNSDVVNAANVLYDITKYELLANRFPARAYTIVCDGLDMQIIYPGVSIYFNYKGVVQTAAGDVVTKNIEGLFYVTSIKVSFDASGMPFYELSISSNGKNTSTLSGVISNALADIGLAKLRIVPNLTYYVNPSTVSPISSQLNDANGNLVAPAIAKTFSFQFGTELLSVNDMKLEITVSRLRSYSYASAPNGGVDHINGSSSIGVSPATNPSTLIASDLSHGHKIGVQSIGGSGFSSLYWSRYADRGNALFDWMYGLYQNNWVPAFLKSYINLNDPEHQTFIGQTEVGGLTYYVWAYDMVGPNAAALQQHTHSPSNPSNVHTITLPDHFHSIAWGVIEEPSTLIADNQFQVSVGGIPVTMTYQRGDTTEAVYQANITDLIMANPSYKTTRFDVVVSSTVVGSPTPKMANVFIKLLGRCTIQAIQS